MITEKIYKFIVIDDHPFIRSGVIGFLKAYKQFEFIGEFGDTRSVINSTFDEIPDLIILDLNLQGIDSEKSFPLLKERFPQSKIVAFTQYEGRGKELEKIGFDGYIVKSQNESLIDILQDVLNGKKYFKDDDKHLSPHFSEFDKLGSFFKLKKLTPREIEVAKFMVQNFSNKEIGSKIFISESTVET